MAVRKYERGPQKLEVLELAKNLCVYTIQITSNEKHFPKRYRWTIVNRIIDEALDVYACIENANDARLVEMYEYRRQQQYEAKAHLSTLGSLIQVAEGVFSLPENTMEYWTDLAYNCQQKLLAWISSDKQRIQNK